MLSDATVCFFYESRKLTQLKKQFYMYQSVQKGNNVMGWIDIEPVEFKFEKAGDKIEGLLNGIRDGKFTKIYDFTLPKGERRFIYGCTKLDQHLPKSLDKYVSVTYKGNVETQGGNTFKDFTIKQWQTTDGSSPEGFDEDVPL
jgi:hypothetical protein